MSSVGKWTVLAVSTTGQMAFSGFVLGLPAVAPAFRETYNVSLVGIGTLLGLVSLGLVSTLYPWGLATDRWGERVVMAAGLGGAALGLVVAARSSSFTVVATALAVAAAFGSSVNSSAGKAIMTSFGSDQRGLALSIRQAGMLVAAAGAALVLPRLAAADGLKVALFGLAAACGLGAVVAVLFIPRRAGTITDDRSPRPGNMARDRRLWRLSSGSSLICVAQSAVAGFLVLFLHDARGISAPAAAAALGLSQLLGAGVRILTGVWSDHVGSRILPLRGIAVTTTLVLIPTAALVSAPLELIIPLFVIGGAVAMGWNVVSFAAAAELGGDLRSGAALGLQQTIVGVTGSITSFVFARMVEASSWRIAWLVIALSPLCGWLVLRRLPVDRL